MFILFYVNVFVFFFYFKERVIGYLIWRIIRVFNYVSRIILVVFIFFILNLLIL